MKFPVPQPPEHYVTSIGEHKIDKYGHVTGVKLPDGITAIEAGAFAKYPNLISVELPHTIKTIEPYAFAGLANLEEIAMQDGVTKIGHTAFAHCGKLKSIMIPHSVTSIGDYACANCASLEQVSLPHHLADRVENVFSGCPCTATLTVRGVYEQIESPYEISTVRAKADEATPFKDCTPLSPIFPNEKQVHRPIITTLGGRSSNGLGQPVNVEIPFTANEVW